MSISSGGFIAVDLLVGRERQIAVTFHPEPFVLENKGLDGVPPHPLPHHHHQPPLHPYHPHPPPHPPPHHPHPLQNTHKQKQIQDHHFQFAFL